MSNYSSIIRRMGHTLLIHFSWGTGLGRFITFSQSSVLVTPAFTTHVISCRVFNSCVFLPCIFDGATFSTPAFSVAPTFHVGLQMISKRTLLKYSTSLSLPYPLPSFLFTPSLLVPFLPPSLINGQ